MTELISTQDRLFYNGDVIDRTGQEESKWNYDEACILTDQQDFNKTSNFLESMTFTSMTAECNCDECCNASVSRKRGNAPIPQSILNAIQSYKRTKLGEVLVKRSQVRTLIGRSTLLKNLAVWELTMPSLAEPLIEHGNPLVYRIIWINRLHKSLIVKQVGCGIIGSNTEEESRQKLDWVENDIIVASNNNRKAIGYVVEPAPLDVVTNNSEDKSSSALHSDLAVLYIAKIPSDLLVDDDECHCRNDEDLSTSIGNNNVSMPYEMIRRICRRAIQSLNNDNVSGSSIRLDQQDQILFRKSIAMMLNK